MADADFVMKQNDTWPPMGVPDAVVLSDTVGPINLTGATIKIFIRKADGSGTPITGTCAIISAPAGTIKYDWDPTDTAVAGEYVFEFQITFGDGKIATVPTEGYKSLTIVDDIAQ